MHVCVHEVEGCICDECVDVHVCALVCVHVHECVVVHVCVLCVCVRMCA